MLKFAGIPLPGARHLILLATLSAAGIAVASGTVSLLRFDDTSGKASAAPPHWPEESRISRSTERPTLLVFAHPLCSCTEATVAELETALARRKAAVRAPSIKFLFVRPRGNSGWTATDLSDKAQRLTGAQVLWDDDGIEARRFGAHTSGSILLYSLKGDLLFEGGVTGARGHVGDNNGLDDLVSAINSEQPAHRTLGMVFGCSLAGSEGRAR